MAWIHTTAGLPTITVHPFVKATLEGLQRMLAKPVVKKEPMTVEMLEAIVRDAEKSGRLRDLRLTTACLLGFSGFLCFDELINLRSCNVVIEANLMRVVVVRSGTITCPVAMLERYLSRTATVAGDERFLFRPIQSTKNGKTLRSSGKISYSCLVEFLKRKLKALGFAANLFGLHSLRAGGDNSCCQCLPDRLFKRHGRGCSENAKDGYVKDSLESRLRVSKALGLYPLCLASFFVTL